MSGCFWCVLGFFCPRLALIGIAIFTDWISAVWTNGFMWPILGWFFLPCTTLAYMTAHLNGGLSGGWIVLLVVAVFIDLGSHGSASSSVKKSDES
jgi:hypothetical protein